MLGNFNMVSVHEIFLTCDLFKNIIDDVITRDSAFWRHVNKFIILLIPKPYVSHEVKTRYTYLETGCVCDQSKNVIRQKNEKVIYYLKRLEIRRNCKLSFLCTRVAFSLCSLQWVGIGRLEFAAMFEGKKMQKYAFVCTINVWCVYVSNDFLLTPMKPQ